MVEPVETEARQYELVRVAKTPIWGGVVGSGRVGREGRSGRGRRRRWRWDWR